MRPRCENFIFFLASIDRCDFRRFTSYFQMRFAEFSERAFQQLTHTPFRDPELLGDVSTRAVFEILQLNDAPFFLESRLSICGKKDRSSSTSIFSQTSSSRLFDAQASAVNTASKGFGRASGSGGGSVENGVYFNSFAPLRPEPSTDTAIS